MRRYLGLDVGGTKCAAIIGDESGAIHHRISWPSNTSRGPDAMVADLCRNAQELLRSTSDIRSAGVAIGGPLDSREGIIYSPPNLPGWDAFPLKAHLQAKLGLPVAVEHDGAACALAEYRWGAGTGAERLGFLTCGTGLGVGLVFDGRIYRGAGGNASDFGHLSYRSDGPEAYGKQGSLEAFAAGSAIVRLAAWRFPDRFPMGSIDARSIAELAATDDSDATEVIALNADAVGDACAILADLLYTNRIVLGSLARYLGPRWIDRVRLRFQTMAHPRVVALCQIVPAGVADRLQDCACYVAATE